MRKLRKRCPLQSAFSSLVSVLLIGAWIIGDSLDKTGGRDGAL